MATTRIPRCDDKVESADRIPAGGRFRGSFTHRPTYLKRVRRCSERGSVVLEKHPDYWPAAHLPGTRHLCPQHARERLISPSGRPMKGWIHVSGELV